MELHHFSNELNEFPFKSTEGFITITFPNEMCLNYRKAGKFGDKLKWTFPQYAKSFKKETKDKHENYRVRKLSIEQKGQKAYLNHIIVIYYLN